jgi:hypothetical protein
MSFDIDRAASPSVPTFKFGQVGHGFAGQIVDVTDGVKMKDEERGTTETYIVVQVEIAKASGGDRERKGAPVTDTPEGEVRSLWLKYESDGRQSFSALTRAIAKAVKDAGAKAIEVGAELRVKHHELGTQNDPKKDAPKLYEASYKAPAKASSVALDDF